MTVNDGDETTMGGRIMLLRSELGYSRECLAEIVGISAKFLYEIETDRKGFSAQILMRLAKALGVTSDYIITGGYEIFFGKGLRLDLEQYEPGTIRQINRILKIVCDLLKERHSF